MMGDQAAEIILSLAHSFQLYHVVESLEVLDLEGSVSMKDSYLSPHYGAASTFTLLCS